MATTNLDSMFHNDELDEHRLRVAEMQRDTMLSETLAPGEVRMVDPYEESMVDRSRMRRGLASQFTQEYMLPIEKPDLVFQKKKEIVRQSLDDPYNRHTEYRVTVKVIHPREVSPRIYTEHVATNDGMPENEAWRILDDWADNLKEHILKEYYEDRQDSSDSRIYRYGEDISFT